MNSFTKNIAPFVEFEHGEAKRLMAKGEATHAFRHLEAAHVLGQRSTYWHVKSHLWMLQWALREHALRECVGQLFRIVGAVITTPFGLIPDGNTGGANVSPFRVMEISENHKKVIGEVMAKRSS